MRQRRGDQGPRLAFITLIMAIAAACGSGAPSATPLPAATSFDEYAVGFCAAFQALFKAVGNPDTAAGSELSKALDDAVTAGDGGAAEQLAGEITAELESGRRHVAYARGWAPAAPMLDQLDRVFVAFEAMTAAKAAKANGAPGAIDPQAALEQAGGIEAWFAMLTAWPTLEDGRPDGVQPCADVPISP
jgi:hypothetical protein